MPVHHHGDPPLHLEERAEQCRRGQAVAEGGRSDGRRLLAAHRLADTGCGHAGQGAYPSRVGNDADVDSRWCGQVA